MLTYTQASSINLKNKEMKYLHGFRYKVTELRRNSK